MKRILIFSLNYYPRFIGGAEVAIKEITDRISPEDIEFHLVTLRFDSQLPAEETIGNVRVHRIGFATKNPSIADLGRFPLHLNKFLYQIAAAYTARRLHAKFRFDGIWAMMAHSCGIPAGIFKGWYPRVPYLLTLQEGDSPRKIEGMMRYVRGPFRAGFTRADYLQSISTFLDAWGKRMGFHGHAEVIPNAVTTKHFARRVTLEERAVMREKLGVAPDDVLLVTTSRLVHKNAIDDAIRAVALLPSNVHFIIYGIGPDEAFLRKLAIDEGVAARIHFMGQIDHAEMPAALKSCDIFIRPSRSEGMGNSFVEAMAAELPVIATQEGGIADFLFDEKRNPDKETTGWAVDTDAPAQIAEAVNDILSRPDKVTQVRETAKKLAFDKYDWDLIATNMRALFDRLLSTR